MLAFTLFCMIRLRDSRLGRAWVAIREDEDAAAAMGIPLMRTKTYAYAIGAFFGGGAGCIFAFYKGATFPNDFYLNISIFILCMVILGGMGNVWGVCVGAVLLSYLNFQGLNAFGNTFNDIAGTNIQRAEVPVPRVRHDHRRRHALPPAGADPARRSARPSSSSSTTTPTAEAAG